MKLPIKKKFFDEIKAGSKTMELRDAHITFVCEETGEEIKKNVRRVEVCCKGIAMYIGKIGTKDADELFTDNQQMIFYLENPDRQ